MSFFKSIKQGFSDMSKKLSNSDLLTNVQNNRDVYLKMSLEEKRKNYLCSSSYIRLDQIQKWSTSALVQYFRSKIFAFR